MRLIKGCAMRGRYDENNKVKQQIEIRDDYISNAITTVQKDSLILILETDGGDD